MASLATLGEAALPFRAARSRCSKCQIPVSAETGTDGDVSSLFSGSQIAGVALSGKTNPDFSDAVTVGASGRCCSRRLHWFSQRPSNGYERTVIRGETSVSVTCLREYQPGHDTHISRSKELSSGRVRGEYVSIE